MPSQPSAASASDEHRGEPDVEHPQEPRRLPDPLGELGDLGAGQLGLEQLAPADAEARQHRDREDDDPHPAEPLGELAPHRRATCESSSKSVTTLAPVVVKPDIPSKYASIGWPSWSPPTKRYGSEAKAAVTSSVTETTRNPSRMPTRPDVLRRQALDREPASARRARRRRGTARPARRTRARPPPGRAPRARGTSPSIPTRLSWRVTSTAGRRVGRSLRVTAAPDVTAR